MQKVIFRDLDQLGYQQAWDYQEALLQETVRIKAEIRKEETRKEEARKLTEAGQMEIVAQTPNYLLFVEHPPVYTLGKSGHIENVLIDEERRKEKGIQFFRTNRGGDITFHGPGQLVGYPILDLENFYTDIGRYLRELEETIILTLAAFGIKGERSPGETGVWIEPGIPGKERKICAIGVRCSRWVTMHGFALNINTDLSYFAGIIPCGIQNKTVTSLEKESGRPVPMAEVKKVLKRQFAKVFGVQIVGELWTGKEGVEGLVS
ncbi:lipoyl(octanoyl) transferase LipB [Flavitalea flava]